MINLGSIVFGAILSICKIPFSARTSMAAAVLLEAISFFAIGLIPSHLVLWIFTFFHGGAGTLLFIYVMTRVQQSAPAAMQGKTFSTIYLAVEIGSTLGLALCGTAAGFVTIKSVLIVLAALTLANLFFN